MNLNEKMWKWIEYLSHVEPTALGHKKQTHIAVPVRNIIKDGNYSNMVPNWEKGVEKGH